MYEHEKVIDVIKRRRIEKGLTQEEVAVMLGYSSKSSYNMIENGESRLSLEHLKKLCRILDISEKDIVRIFFEN